MQLLPKADLVVGDDDDDAPKKKGATKEAVKPRVAAADLRRVEVSSVLEQGLAMARKEDPRFKLTSAHAVNVRGGLRVDGYDRYRREIDVDSCEIVRDWSKR